MALYANAAAAPATNMGAWVTNGAKLLLEEAELAAPAVAAEIPRLLSESLFKQSVYYTGIEQRAPGKHCRGAGTLSPEARAGTCPNCTYIYGFWP